MKDEMLIRCCSYRYDEKLRYESYVELNNLGIQLGHPDTLMHSGAPLDLNLIEISYLVIQNFMLSSSYELFKYAILKLWSSMRPRIKDVPFTIEIDGIPTINGPEKISCNVYGDISEVQKSSIINKSFELANNVSDGNQKLLEKSIYYNIGGHVFNVDPITLEVSEIDFEAEVRKNTKE